METITIPPLPSEIPTLNYNIKWIQNYINKKYTLVHLAGFNGLTFCGQNHLTINTSNVYSEVTCLDCRAEYTLDKYKTFATLSAVPIYLHGNVLKAMKEFLNENIKHKDMIEDPSPANIATDEYIHIYLKDHLTNPHKILGDAYFQEREGYSTWWRQFDGRTICVFAAPTYNILYFEHKIEARK